MKKGLKKIILLMIISFTLVLLFPGGVWAEETGNIPEPSSAPLNPDFVQYMVDLEGGNLTCLNETGHYQGYIPSPLKRYEGSEESDRIQTMSLPETYDLRILNRVTAIRDQNPYGTCWSFASLASLESYLKKGVNTDLSENNLVWNHGFDLGPYNGGNSAMTTAYLARWSGPVSETSDPYGSTQKKGLSPDYHVQEVDYISRSASEIKQALMEGGALSTAMYSGAFDSEDYYSSTNAVLYYNGNQQTDHDVAIVGWDDSFDRNKFNNPPPGNGAWIIRNSWGTDWGDDGYFYMSYYDTYAGNEVTAFHNAESTDNYKRIYQYDPLGNTGAMGYQNNNNTTWGTNIFTAVASENLTAISTYALSPNTTFEISVYTNVNTGEPRSGTLETTKLVTIPRDGYYTVKLDTPVKIIAGQKFSIVIKYTTPDNDMSIPIEKPIANYSSAASANPNESLISYNGINAWYDLSTEKNSNICIKAFTEGSQPVILQSIAITTPASKLSYKTGEALDISQLVVTGTYSDGTSKVETITADNITGFDSSKAAADQVLTIKVNDKTVTYTVQIVNPTLLGDVDGSGQVQAFDALMALQIATGKKTGTVVELKAADVDASGSVLAFDALRILQYTTGRITAF